MSTEGKQAGMQNEILFPKLTSVTLSMGNSKRALSPIASHHLLSFIGSRHRVFNGASVNEIYRIVNCALQPSEVVGSDEHASRFSESCSRVQVLGIVTAIIWEPGHHSILKNSLSSFRHYRTWF